MVNISSMIGAPIEFILSTRVQLAFLRSSRKAVGRLKELQSSSQIDSGWNVKPNPWSVRLQRCVQQI
jgi:hypothetical protein